MKNARAVESDTALGYLRRSFDVPRACAAAGSLAISAVIVLAAARCCAEARGPADTFTPARVGTLATASRQKQAGPAILKPPVTRIAKAAPGNSGAGGPAVLPPSLPPPQLTEADLTAFFDGLVPLQIESNDIAGAVVAVVRDGKVIFAKGYGYADLAKKKPVSPEDTLFRCGSISKLFTWTAVMQLVQDGKINLDADINQYLDFKVPQPFGKPITMRDLMTHTPGFEETIRDLITVDPTHIPSLRDYLVNHEPKEIFPPGTTGAYSNYGATLAGYIVQRVSGQPFDDYIEQHIFGPLGMTHATFRQPLPKNLQPLMSQGYERASGGAKKFEIVTPFPAGSVAISAMDITHFMMAQLQEGTYNGAQILNPETVKLMHTRQYAPDPRVNAMCLGFYEETRNGHRIIGHGGDTEYFHSDLHLILDANTGLFVSYNSAGRGDVAPRGPLFDKFLDRYFPYTPPKTTPLRTAAMDTREVSGSYIPSRRSQTNIFYLFSLLGEAGVAPGKDGSLVIADFKGINGQPIEWHEVQPQVWQDISDAQNKIVFAKNSDGRWQIALGFPAEVLQQVPWYQSKTFIQWSIVFAFVVFALTLILWPVAALARRHYGRPVEAGPREQRARRWARIVCGLDLAFWALFLATIVYGGGHLGVLTRSLNPWLRFIQIIGWLGAFGTLLAIWNFAVSVGTAGRWWWAKTHDTLILLACLVSVWIVWYTHLLSFSLNY
ncbi:MAG TPA: serine hydrolase domain-containing protein [Candidatus Acidoferrales bacterium]|nr:serine hydrolase domain-containing protein [Candidatus Acidoferrales bacterium]